MEKLGFVILTFVSSTFVHAMSVALDNATLSSVGIERLGLTPVRYYMSDYCSRQKILRSRDAIVVSPWKSQYPPSRQSCVFGINGGYLGYIFRFVITFKSMGLYGKTPYECERSRLDLYDGKSRRISDEEGLCGTKTDYESYETQTTFLTLQYITNHLPPHISQTFEAVITPFHFGACNGDEFRCNNGKCIRNDMTCDSYDNCGDNSDELSCIIGLTVAAIVGIVLGCLFFIAFVTTIIVCWCCCGWCAIFRYEKI